MVKIETLEDFKTLPSLPEKFRHNKRIYTLCSCNGSTWDIIDGGRRCTLIYSTNIWDLKSHITLEYAPQGPNLMLDTIKYTGRTPSKEDRERFSEIIKNMGEC